MLADDQPIASLPGHIRPNPLQEDAQTETRCGEELQVYRRPSEPRADPAYLDFATLQHRKTLAHDGHAALVKVTEGTKRWFANNAVVNQLSCITPLLHRHLRYTWQRFAVLIEGHRIADNENLGISGHGKVFLNAYPPCVIHFGIQPLARGRGCDACSPDHRFACDALARDYDAFRVDVIDAVSEPDFDTQLLESLFRSSGETLGKCSQNVSRINEHNSRRGWIDPAEV